MQNNYNPDVLSCLASLSNDEVFTPPELVNDMLDLLPAELWRNPQATFLDPVTKSGVFLREIAKRLMLGLEQKIPDRQERINHIFTKQLFGIALTELTALLSRRSIYCSKYANSDYSVCTEFDGPDGNVYYQRMQHSWQSGKCGYCGASQEVYDRGDESENYAYNFIHTTEPREIFNMKFDVIIGNPPYQLGSDGGTRDVPIYNKFVEQAKKMNPRYLCMIIPSRWMSSGLGLTEFRETMLNDNRISHLIDFPVASEVFQGVEIKGGVCYFLWQKDYHNECNVTMIRSGESLGPFPRKLGKYDVFVRDARSEIILNKILKFGEESITSLLSVDKEFGWTSNFEGFDDIQGVGKVPLFYIRKGIRAVGWIDEKKVLKSRHLIDTYKVLIPAAGSDGGQKIPDIVLGKPLIVGSPSVCTQSFLFFYVNSLEEAQSIQSYLATKFFRFLVSLRKITQHATKSTYTWVPLQKWDCLWTDVVLYKKYGLSDEEIAFIESMIRPIELSKVECDDEEA